jgi:hypothetical protein
MSDSQTLKENAQRNLCIAHSVEEMNDPVKCLSYMVLTHQHEPNVSIKELEKRCKEFNEKTTVGFYSQLCNNQMEAYKKTFENKIY